MSDHAVEHDLKTLPIYFDAVERWDKTFEIRRDDRGFQRGDIVRLLRLHENPYGALIFSHREKPESTSLPELARSVKKRIRWILTGGQFGLEPGYVVLALGPFEEADHV